MLLGEAWLDCPATPPALLFGVTSSSSLAMEATVTVPGCPSPVLFELNDYWSDASRAPDIIQILSENNARTADYTAAWKVEQEGADPAWVAIGTLGSLKPAQGKITAGQFEGIRSTYLAQVENLSPEIREAVRERSDALARGAFVPFDQPEYMLFGSLEDERSFAVLGLVTSAQIAGISAQKHFFWNGCMAVAQFSFPLASLQPESAEAAINDVSLLAPY